MGYTVPGTIYIGNLFPTCDPSLNAKLPQNHPANCYVSPAVWQQVNYILNHKNNAYFWDVQVAINNLVGGPPQGPSPPFPTVTAATVQSLLNDASANAANWVPQCGNVIGALYAITNQAGVALTAPVQLLMIEVPVSSITFTRTPPSTNLGCNPNVANIPVAKNPVDTNLVYAVSCAGYPVTITASQSDSTNGCQVTRTITYTAADGLASSATYVQTIIWTTDSTPPVIISIPANTDLGCNPSSAAIPSDVSVKSLVSASEGCSTSTVNVSHVDGGTPCAMVRTFTITVSDACGNATPAKSVVYTWKVDTTLPTIISVPSSGSLGCNPAVLPTDASIAALVKSSDNCAVLSNKVSHVDSTNVCVTTRIFTVSVVDVCGNVSANAYVTNSWTIDKIGPVILCPADITISNLVVTNCTYNRDDYGKGCDGTNAGSILTNCFKKIYTNGWIHCGITNVSGNYCAKFTNCDYIQKFTKCTNTPVCLKTNYVNPTNCEAGDLASHVLCLKLNVDLGDRKDVSGFSGGCGDLVLNDTSCGLHGKKVREILDICQKAVGGCDVSSYGCTLSNLSTVCSNINDAFRGCKRSTWCNGHMVTTNVVNISPSVTGTASVSDKCGGTPTLTYSDVVVGGQCSGNYQVIRTWIAVDACNNTNSCTQNIYVGGSTSGSVCGTVFADCNADGLLTPLTDSGISNIVVTLYGSNNVVLGTNKTDAAGNYCFYGLAAGTYTVAIAAPTNCVQTAGTHTNHWIDSNTYKQCWNENDGYTHSKGTDGVDCWASNDGCQHHKTGDGQDCWTDKSNVTHTQACNYVSCDAPKNHTETFTLTPCEAKNGVNFAYAGAAPKVTVCASGPGSCVWSSPISYTICVTNSGNTCLKSCVVNACGNNYTCPDLGPGEGCKVTCNYQSGYCFGWGSGCWYSYGNYWNSHTCQPVVTCKAPGVSSSCSAQTSCSTYLSYW